MSTQPYAGQNGRHRRARIATGLGAVLVATMLPMVGSTSAHAAAMAKAWDFDGDGQRDLAVGQSGENDNAGAVTVMRGTADGLGTGSAKRFSQETKGVPGTDETGDQFGGSLASGDFDSDGFADLAIGAASEDDGDDPETGGDVGAVTILYGSDKGLTTKGAHRLDRDDEFGESDRVESTFGYELAAADYDNDGDADLVVATGSGLGGVLVYEGRNAGLEDRLPALQIGPEDGLPDTLTSGFASSLASGDLDSNGLPDLVIGLQENDFARGAVAVVYSAKNRGLDPTGEDVRQAQIWTQDTAGVKGTAEPLDAFGSAVAIGDYTGDGHSDLVVSAVQEPNLTVGVTGALHMIRGTNNGLSASGDEYQRHENIIGDPHGALGAELEIAKLNGDRADIVVTAASNDALGNRWGRVLVLYANVEGIGQGKQQDFTQATSGIPGGVSPTADYWGEMLRIRDVGKSAAPDLIVADPRELIGTDNEVGRVVVLWGSKSGLDADRSRSLTQDAKGVPGTNEAGDRFGIAL